MPDLFPEIEVSDREAEAMARALFAVARADGEVHPGEEAMITEFYADVTNHPSDLGALARAPRITGDELAAALAGQELRRLFLKTALLLAYTDNGFGPGEAAAIREYAEALEVSSAELEDLQVQAREFLLAQLAHLRNVEGVAAVAGELKD